MSDLLRTANVVNRNCTAIKLAIRRTETVLCGVWQYFSAIKLDMIQSAIDTS